MSDRSADRKTILLAEDETHLRKAIRDMLIRGGYETLEAATAQEALAFAVKDGRIDLLLANIVMPEMNGAELVERVRKIRPGLKVLFVSGYTPELIFGEHQLEEQIKFLDMPLAPNALARRIERILGADGKGDTDRQNHDLREPRVD